MPKRVVTGNEALILGALMADCTHFFGYPITPASEVAEAAAHYFPASGRTFLQAESELSAINMLYGASSCGARAMTASSGPGIALMGEGLSYLAGARLPAVIVDIQRAGPGLGNIWPEQSDYNMVVKGGGHGNYSNIVLTPASVQEMYDFTKKAFDLAQKYRMNVFILADGYLGQMMEALEIDSSPEINKRQEWALYGDKASRDHLITSIYMSVEKQSDHNKLLQAVYREVEEKEVDWQEYNTEQSSILMIAYGITSRICRSAIEQLKARGTEVGLLRLKSAFPFPKKRLKELSASHKRLIVVEMSSGQMADDVVLATGNLAVEKFLTYGGKIPTVAELITYVEGGPQW
ncbi:MAG: 3-methyl-2-oxobutanoate dehydrogenase subunit VorB [Sphaerochaetaceae bacterium]